MIITFVYSAEGRCSAQQIQDQALPEVLDHGLLRLRAAVQLHPQGAGEPAAARRHDGRHQHPRQVRHHARRHVQVSLLRLRCSAIFVLFLEAGILFIEFLELGISRVVET